MEVQFSRSNSGLAPVVTGREKKLAHKRLSLRELLRPQMPALVLGFVAVVGEGAANLLQPWPLKLVLDDVIRSHQSHASLMRWIYDLVGTNNLAVLKFALPRCAGDCRARRHLHVCREIFDHQREPVGHV